MEKRKVDCESGYTMIGVLIIFVIIAVLGLSIVTLSFASVQISTSERSHQSAYYIAEAGLTYQTEKMKKDIIALYKSDQIKTAEDFWTGLESLLTDAPIIYDGFDAWKGSHPFAEVSISMMEGTHDQLIIESIGIIETEQRKVSNSFLVEWIEKYKEITRDPYELPPFAVFTVGSLTMTNGIINGDIGTVSQIEGTISFPEWGPRHEGSIYVPDGDPIIVDNELGDIQSEIKTLDQSYVIPELPAFPEIPDRFSCPVDQTISLSEGLEHKVIEDCNLYINSYIVRDSNYQIVMDQDVKFDQMIFEEGYELIIDTGNTDKAIVVKSLNLGNGRIILKGSGKLTIYVVDELQMGAGSKINEDGHINHLNIFYDGEDPVVLADDQKIFGSIYVEEAKLDLTGSGGIYGNVFTGGNEIKLSGGSNITTQLILAPYADAILESGGKIEGMIISNTFKNDGGAEVRYGVPFILDGPISPAALDLEDDDSNGDTYFVETGATPTFTLTPTREK